MWQKSNNYNLTQIKKTQNITKLENLKGDKTQKLKIWKTQQLKYKKKT